MSRAFDTNQSVGEYRVVDFLGAGGMGEVYRAMHQKIGRVAAVKVLTQATQSSGFVERFFNEARIQASLQHPNVATLYDFCEVQGQPCIIMEYVDGQTI
ncbi:MAG TPA: protein kinase, partial [Pyrinomonadaceae bacterium]